MHQIHALHANVKAGDEDGARAMKDVALQARLTPLTADASPLVATADASPLVASDSAAEDSTPVASTADQVS